MTDNANRGFLVLFIHFVLLNTDDMEYRNNLSYIQLNIYSEVFL